MKIAIAITIPLVVLALWLGGDRTAAVDYATAHPKAARVIVYVKEVK